MSRTQVWVAAISTLACFSYLYKENFFFRLAEHTMIPLYVAHSITTTYHVTFKPYYNTHVVGKGWWWFWLFFVAGLLYYFRFAPAKYSWLTRYPISMSIGWTLGSYFSIYPRATGVRLADAIRDLSQFENVLFFLAWATAMMYFFLTVGGKSKTFQTASKAGRWVLMMYFGSAFGNTVQGRFTLLLGRLQFLLTNWMGIQI